MSAYLDADAIAQWLKERSGGTEWSVVVTHYGAVVTIEPKAPMPEWEYRAVVDDLAYRMPPRCSLIHAVTPDVTTRPAENGREEQER